MKTLALSIFIFLLAFSFSSQQSQDTQTRPALVTAEMNTTMGGSELLTPRTIDSGCMISGCFNELCMNLASNVTLTCNYPFRREFKCYEHSDCRLLADGRCDWQPKESLNDCLRASRAGVTPLEPLPEARCVTDGCYNEFCHLDTLPRMLLDRCDYRPEFECLRLTRCRLMGDRCDFEMNRDYRDCIDSMEMLARDEMRLRRRQWRRDFVNAVEPRREDMERRREERREDMERRTDMLDRRELGRDREFRREPELLPRREPELLPREFPIRASKMVSDTGRMNKQMQ